MFKNHMFPSNRKDTFRGHGHLPCASPTVPAEVEAKENHCSTHTRSPACCTEGCVRAGWAARFLKETALNLQQRRHHGPAGALSHARPPVEEATVRTSTGRRTAVPGRDISTSLDQGAQIPQPLSAGRRGGGQGCDWTPPTSTAPALTPL